MSNSITNKKQITVDDTIKRNNNGYGELANKCKDIRLKRRKSSLGKTINVGMAIALSTSIVGVLTGSKKTHVIGGLIFMSFGALHVHKHKKRVF